MRQSPPPSGPPDRRRTRSLPSPQSMIGVGLEFSGVVVLLTLGGWWLDRKWGTSPWLTLTGLFIGTVGGLYKVWRLGRRFFD